MNDNLDYLSIGDDGYVAICINEFDSQTLNFLINEYKELFISEAIIEHPELQQSDLICLPTIVSEWEYRTNMDYWEPLPRYSSMI